MNEQEEKTGEAAPEEDYWVAEGYDERATVLCELVETFGLPYAVARQYTDEWFGALGD